MKAIKTGDNSDAINIYYLCVYYMCTRPGYKLFGLMSVLPSVEHSNRTKVPPFPVPIPNLLSKARKWKNPPIKEWNFEKLGGEIRYWRWIWIKNKPKMAYSHDLPKMAVWHYGLKLQCYLTGNGIDGGMDDCHG